jgi:hypothetical protein
MSLTPEQRVLRARIAAHSSWASTPDRRARTAPGAAASHGLDRFMREVDPDGALDPVERVRRAESARKAHFARLAYASAKVRRERRAGSAEVAEDQV